MPPRTVNLAETALDAALNVFESNVDKLQEAGVDVTGFGLVSPAVRQKALDYLAQHGVLLPWIETGMKAALFFALPDLTQEQKLAIGSVLDVYVDGVRRAAQERNDDAAEVTLTKASGEFRNNLKTALAELTKQRAKKPPFDKMVLSLSGGQRTRFSQWVVGMTEAQKREWLRYKPQISSHEVLGQVVDLGTSVERFQFLTALYDREVTPLERLKDTAQAVLRGEETPHTRVLRERVQDTDEKLKNKGDEWERKAEAIRRRNRQR